MFIIIKLVYVVFWFLVEFCQNEEQTTDILGRQEMKRIK